MITLFKNKERGYTLLFSVIVASVVLAMSAFILQVSRKQFFLSSVWRDSTIAIYAADSGIQCVAQAFEEAVDLYQGGDIDCGGDNLNKDISSSYDDIPTVTGTRVSNGNKYIYRPAYLPNGACFIISAIYGQNFSNSNEYILRIESSGYNISSETGGSCPTPNPRAVERAIKLEYRGPKDLFEPVSP